MRRLVTLGVVAASLTACGGRQRVPAQPPVQLQLTSPSDLMSVQASRITVSGTVVPAGARVLVDGREAEVVDGRFSAEVDLDGGPNVIDVQAAAPRRPAAMTAVRVTRLVPVRIPDVTGYVPAEAVAALERLGLQAQVKDTNIFDPLIPLGTRGVCRTVPEAGSRVRVGSTVTVEVQKSC